MRHKTPMKFPFHYSSTIWYRPVFTFSSIRAPVNLFSRRKRKGPFWAWNSYPQSCIFRTGSVFIFKSSQKVDSNLPTNSRSACSVANTSFVSYIRGMDLSYHTSSSLSSISNASACSYTILYWSVVNLHTLITSSCSMPM